MGRLTEDWQSDFLNALTEKGIHHQEAEASGLILLKGYPVAVHLVPLGTDLSPESLIEFQHTLQIEGICLVHLWEDIWYTRRSQVLGRIESLLGLNRKLHGRKAKVSVINQKEADDFLLENHLQGSAKVKYKFALKIEDKLVAVALFSAGRPMKQLGPDYRSYELVRFASLIGYTVTGGFTKLLKHFIHLVRPNDIMSYADRDWSLGHAYDQSAFKLVETLPPAMICLDQQNYNRIFPHRLPVELQEQWIKPDETLQRQLLLDHGYQLVFNTGNLKYILYL